MDTNTAALGGLPLPRRAAAPAPQAMARLAGLLYLVIAVAAGVAHFYVPAQLVVPGDAAATTARIAAGEALFRAGIGSELLVLLSEVALSVALYLLLRPVSNGLALAAAAFRLTMTAVHAANLISSFAVLALLGGAAGGAFAGAQLHGLVQLLLDAHDLGFAVGIVFLIPHVFLLGYLIIRSGYLPRALGALFLLAACGYLFDSAALLFAPGYGETPAPLALLIAASEIAFPLWLLVRGVDAEGWGRRTAGA